VEDLRIPERVARGVDWLDEHVAAWWLPEKINLDNLIMRQPCHCILGQLYGWYYNAPLSSDESALCGFDTTVRYDYDDYRGAEAAADAEFAALADEWTRVVLERRAGAPS
jgi:hypothetical protein